MRQPPAPLTRDRMLHLIRQDEGAAGSWWWATSCSTATSSGTPSGSQPGGAGAGRDRARAQRRARRRGQRRGQRRRARRHAACWSASWATTRDGAAIRQELAVARLDDRHVITVAGRPTTSKTRIIARSQQVVRIDDEVETPCSMDPTSRGSSRVARDALADADALLLEDYNKGALAPTLIMAVMEVARRRGIPIVVDPKFRQFFEYAGRHRLQAQSAGARVRPGRRGRPAERRRPARGARAAPGRQPARHARRRGHGAGDEGRQHHAYSEHRPADLRRRAARETR